MVAVVVALALFLGVCNGAPGGDRLVPDPGGRIVGGSPATVQQYPSIVQVNNYVLSTNYWVHDCGGNILTNNVVLTAAHCVRRFFPSFHSIRAGATMRNVGGVIHYISSILVHPHYSDFTVEADADIALLRLRDNLVYTDTINFISIPPQNFIIPGNSPGIYAGWGVINDEETDVLLHVDVNILSHDECERRYQQRINEDVVCAGYDGKDACRGDSGGPLYYGGVLVGVVSWGPFPCGHPIEPGAAIRTAAYTDWIVANA